MISCFRIINMSEITNKFLLAGDKFIFDMHLKQSGFTVILVNHLVKIKKELKNLKKQEIQSVFIEMN